MKPREFDDLVRQKFDQNDFAYDPANWDRLAEQMDGRAKKRSMLMWLWMPALGMAASVALAVGVTGLLKHDLPGPGNNNTNIAYTGKFMSQPSEKEEIAMVPYIPPVPVETTPEQRPVKKIIRRREKAVAVVHTSNSIGLRLSLITDPKPEHTTNRHTSVTMQSATHATSTNATADNRIAPPTRVIFKTFRDDLPRTRKTHNLSVTLAGGISQGNRNSGYMAGASVRKMVNDKVYVEGDFAFTTSDNIQRTMYMSYDNTGGAGVSGGGTGAAKPSAASASKTTSTTGDAIDPGTSGGPVGVVKTRDISYNLYYAQISPSVGYKVAKRLSVGMGPDFQKMLVDNRPATSIVDRGNLQVAPTFDVGFIGKTEYALTQRVKAGVSYRKGINGVINPSDKYIDRDYLQFQMKCTIFNR